MPRIIVTTDLDPDQLEPAVLLDEQVHSVHLSNAHASAQLVERLAWAITDAERTQIGAREQGGPIDLGLEGPPATGDHPDQRLAA